MFFLNVLVSGLMAGLMYAMVAIGFVLIYKASGVFNFAQGTMVFFAALTFVVLNEHGLPFWAAFPITVLVMIIGAVLIERLVLRPLVNRSPNTLFMATLGLSFVIEGLAQSLFGSDVHQLDLGIDDTPLDLFGLQISAFDIFASVISIVMVAVLATLFSKTRMGISLRAVADDTLAAQSVGIRLPYIWHIVWSVSGFVALVAGLLWGASGRAIFAVAGGPKSHAGAHHRRLLLHSRRHRRRPAGRSHGKPGRHLHRPACPRQRLQLVRLHPGRSLLADPAVRAVRRRADYEGLIR